MESLLSLAFDNLSSYDGPKIKKGLKQVEGLLAQICLSSPKNNNNNNNNNNNGSPKKSAPTDNKGDPSSPPRKVLADLGGDPAFREFFKLQEGFEWNIAQRLIPTLDWLAARGGDGQYDLLIVTALDLIRGVLLLHPPSKTLFSRSMHMNLLLDLIEPMNNCPAVQCATIITLVVALLDSPQNTRVFERADGLLTITSLFKDPSTPREVKFKLTEFLYYYLTPETPSIPRAESRASAQAGLLQRSPSKLAKVFGRGGGGGGGGAINPHVRERAGSENGNTLPVEVKKQYVDRYLPGVVDQLLKDLDTYKPFGGILS
ncbi:cell division protein Cdc14 [Bombardia bombarda]|uniref:Cell division protein Cdc14 n=1 Tax=Bombardia bombarda TaxID=252184 RepID=A0AA40CFL9_9PEZI|nr:cell division protein Cdc14 [Bombardia bombarda]